MHGKLRALDLAKHSRVRMAPSAQTAMARPSRMGVLTKFVLMLQHLVPIVGGDVIVQVNAIAGLPKINHSNSLDFSPRIPILASIGKVVIDMTLD